MITVQFQDGYPLLLTKIFMKVNISHISEALTLLKVIAFKLFKS